MVELRGLAGVAAACSGLLLVALCGLPVKEPAGSFLAATEHVVSWARPRPVGVELGQRSVVLTQVAVRLRTARAVAPRQLLPKKARKEPKNGTALPATRREPAGQGSFAVQAQAGSFDSPAWRKEHGLPGKVFYLHIWKCGGTNMCNIARANGELANPDWGCHAPDTSRANGWRPCSEPDRFTSMFPQLTFVGSECPLRGNEPFDSPEWTFVVVLREPLTQATSWYLHARQIYKDRFTGVTFYDWTKKVKTQRGIFFDQFEDNLQTRFLCGWSCNEKPVLDQSDYEKAKANLLKFKVVLRVEELNSVSQTAGSVLGWHMLSGEDKSVGTKRHVTEAQAQVKFPNAAKSLKDALTWDVQLYEFSKTLPQR